VKVKTGTTGFEVVLFLRAGVQPTLDPCIEAFYEQAQCASPGGEEFG